ncbi:hypothetical protein NIES2111_26330 [Nostoc sp. NIES-2111]|nr:hypothetical protein NIES2111_26330 [Nostoc sp. NIES-2111]
MKAIQIKAMMSGASSALLLIFLVACRHLQSQQKPLVVPQAIESAFKAKYPNVSHTWQIHHYGYEAIFTQENIEYEAEFSVTGEWLETEYYVTAKEFPNAVLKRIKKAYPQFTITKYEIELTPQGIFYEVDITDGETEEELYFDSSGNTKNDLYED